MQYTVTASNYGSYIFNHWDDGTTSASRTWTLSQQTVLTAHYGAPTYTVNVQSISLSGAPIKGLWTTVQSNGKVVATGFTPFSFLGTAGDTYTVTVSNYDNYAFDHWDNWGTSPSRTFTLTQNIWYTALYLS